MSARVLLISLVACLSGLAHAQVGLSAGELKLFNLLNQERKRAGLAQFQWDYHLAESARAHTQMMEQHRILTHQFPGEAALADRIGATGARFNGAAENVAMGDIDHDADMVAKLHASLMNSPEHRANILSPKYNAVGLAIVSGFDQMWVTEDFSHGLPAYTEEQFRQSVFAAFNKARQANGLPVVALREDSRMHDLACAEYDKPEVPQSLSNALDTVVFTSSEPEKLPSDMQKAASDRALRRMSLGTCFRPEKEHGFAAFWVVAAFYP